MFSIRQIGLIRIFPSLFSIFLSRIWNGSLFEHVRWILWLIYDRQQPYLLNVSFFLYANLLDWQQQRQWVIYAFTKTENNKSTAIKLCVLCLSLSLCSPVISNEWYAVKRQRIMATISSYFLSPISFTVSFACVEDSIPSLSPIFNLVQSYSGALKVVLIKSVTNRRWSYEKLSIDISSVRIRKWPLGIEIFEMEAINQINQRHLNPELNN